MNKVLKYFIQVWMIGLILSSCSVNTLEEVENLESVVSLVQISEEAINLTADNLIIDKQTLMFRKAFGLALSGFQINEGFNADIVLDYNDIPEGCIPMTPNECFLTLTDTGTERINSLTVPAGSQQGAFYLNITKAALDTHEGSTLGVKISVQNLSKYSLNPLNSTYIILNTNNFASKRVDVTDIYFKNPTFKRKDGTTTRFAPLQDWISNDAINNSRADGAGYDQNAGFMGIERWSSGDKSIINGKIFQTFTLPKGRYEVQVNMRQVVPDRDSYILAALGNDLPDDIDVATAIGKHELTTLDAQQLITIEFSLDEDRQVSIGFLFNFDAQTQRVIQASRIYMYRLDSFFD
jgi:hypothetical protein